MTNQYSGRQPDNRPSAERVGEATKQTKARDTRPQLAEDVQGTMTSAKTAASEAASTITEHVKDLLNTQLAHGANIVGQFGNSAQRAAEDLEKDSPQLAGLVRGVAGRIEGYADDLRGQSVDDLFQSATNFTRRQPALVFGLAAVAGFFALRTIKSSALPPQPDRVPRRPSAGEYHGA